MRDNKAIGAAAILVTVGSWVALWISTAGGLGPGINPKPHEASGWMMARQALKLLKPGGQIVVIARDTTSFKNPASDIQLASFKATLREAGVGIAKVQALHVDPLRPVEVPRGDFFELVKNTPKGAVIVSFMGPPILSEAQRKQLGEVKPSIVAFCSGSLPEHVDLRTLMEQGLLQVAVVSRTNAPRNESSPSDRQGWFEQSFAAVTAANTANALNQEIDRK